MSALVGTMASVFLLTFLAAPAMGAGWYWDVGNAVGFAAFAGLLYLTITSNRRLDVRAHQVLGYGVLLVTVTHAFWFLLGDAAIPEFLKPGAPAYMWFGVVSILLLGLLITVALVPDRMRVHRSYPAFRSWHRIFAVSTIASATYHIVASNFYLGTWFQAVLFICLAIAASAGRAYWIKLGQLRVVSNAAFVLTSVFFCAVFVVVRNLPV